MVINFEISNSISNELNNLTYIRIYVKLYFQHNVESKHTEQNKERSEKSKFNGKQFTIISICNNNRRHNPLRDPPPYKEQKNRHTHINYLPQ